MTATAYPPPSADVNQPTIQTPAIQVRPPLEMAALVRDFLEDLHQEIASRKVLAGTAKEK